MIYAAAASLLLSMYAGFFMPRPAGPAARAAGAVSVRTSVWTWIAMAHWVLVLVWLHVSPIVDGPRSPSGRWLVFAVESLFVSLLLWMARSFSREITLHDGRLTVRGPLRKTITCPVAELGGIRAAPPTFIFELTLADRTKLVLHPFLQNADELSRRIILQAPNEVIARIEGPAREGVLQLIEAERAVQRGGERSGASND